MGREQGPSAGLAAVAFIGPSGSGKTTLITALLPRLAARGLRVGYLKGSHKGFDVDRDGKDSDRAFRGGATRVVLASPTEGFVRFRLAERDPRALLAEHFRECDLVLVEGFKDSDLFRIEVVRGEELTPAGDPLLLAVVREGPDPRPVPRFRPGDHDALARFVAEAAPGTMGRP